MKQILFSLLIVLGFSLTAQAQNVPAVTAPVKEMKTTTTKTVNAATDVETTNAKMTFETTTVDFGTIENGSDPLRTITFTNTGTEPLVIKNARGSCGCTVPTWDKNPIAPGQSSTIEIRYDTKRTGPINKTVTITTNEESDTHKLQVVGTVLPPAEKISVPAAAPSVIK